MRTLLRAQVLTASAAWAIAGCTIYPEHKAATLATTTSAEQTQRIFWKDVEAGKWAEVNALLAPNVVWRSGNQVLEREAIVPWLQSAGIHHVTMTDTRLKPNVNDMTLLYSLQAGAQHSLVAHASTQPGQAPAAAASQCLQNLQAVAVWQQPQPGSSRATTGLYGGYLLTVEDLTLDPGAGAAAPCQGSG